MNTGSILCFLLSVGGYVAGTSESLPPTPAPPSARTRFAFALDPFHNEIPPDCASKSNRTGMSTRGGGLINTYYRWENSFNIYIDEAYDDMERQAINEAAYKLWMVIPCIRFGIWPRGGTPSGDYIHIIKGTNNGCNSYVGRQRGRQNMNLQSPGCMGVGTIMHEMLHALGFEHEHERPDRDDFINVNYDNIQDGLAYAFDKQSWSRVTIYDEPYNYNSIMHYYSYAFSKNGQPTMTKKNGELIPYMRELQDSDIRQLKAMYPC